MERRIRRVTTFEDLLSNVDGLYLGNLWHYFFIAMYGTQIYNEYHNFRHGCHVLWVAAQLCRYYRGRLTPLEIRCILVVALVHDINHRGRMVNRDDREIRRALKALLRHVAPEDRPYLKYLKILLKGTRYPYKDKDPKKIPLGIKILRDADRAQSFSSSWIQHVVLGIAKEMGISILECLKVQIKFHQELEFSTAAARKKFPPRRIQAKIRSLRTYQRKMKQWHRRAARA
jgi:hypothetical protein